MRQFFFLNIEASFGRDSPGVAKKSLIDWRGEARLGRMAWDIGSEAFSRLQGADGSVLTHAEIERYIKDSEEDLSKFVEELIELHKLGRIEMSGLNDEAGVVDYSSWRRGETLWKMETELRVMNAAQQQLGAPGSCAGPRALLVSLGFLEQAIAASYDDQAEEVADCVLNANWFLSLVKNEELIDAAERKKASERAKAGHARSPKRAAKDIVRECWIAWEQAPGQYKNVAHFARAMLDKFPDTLETEVTVSRWVRAWRGGGAIALCSQNAPFARNGLGTGAPMQRIGNLEPQRLSPSKRNPWQTPPNPSSVLSSHFTPPKSMMRC